MRSLAYALVWVFVFAMPWENAVVLPGVGTITRVLGLVTFGAGVLAAVMDGKFRRPGLFLVVTTLFVIWSLTSAFWAIDSFEVVRRSKTYAQLALMVWLLWELAPSGRSYVHALQAYVLGAFVVAGATLWNYLSGAVAIEARYTAAESNANDLAMILVLAIPIAWYLSLVAHGWFWRWTNRLYVPIGVIAVLLTASRGGLITTLVALTIVLWTVGSIRWTTRIAVVALLVVGAFGVSKVVPQSSWERLATTHRNLQSGDIGSRGVIWRAGLRAFDDHKLAGVGAGGFGYAVEPELGREFAAHNAFIAVLVELGFVGLALFGALFVAAIRPWDHFASTDSRFRIVLFATLVIGVMPLNWDYAKPMWFVLTMLATQPAMPKRSRAGWIARQAISAVPLTTAASRRRAVGAVGEASPQPVSPHGGGVA
jgi:O-antigen ligase